MNRTAVAHLRGADPVMRNLIARVGPCRYSASRDGTHFHFLARAIVYQQLSGKAAATIFGRLVERAGGSFLDARNVGALSVRRLRGAGLSQRKTEYVRGLAAAVKSGELDIERIHELDDGAIIERLVQLNGVGTWTAQMFLMFRLGRPDILPSTDLGVRKGVQVAYRLRQLPAPERVERIGGCWSPYRSVASWYLWRLLDLDAAERRENQGA